MCVFPTNRATESHLQTATPAPAESAPAPAESAPAPEATPAPAPEAAAPAPATEAAPADAAPAGDAPAAAQDPYVHVSCARNSLYLASAAPQAMSFITVRFQIVWSREHRV